MIYELIKDTEHPKNKEMDELTMTGTPDYVDCYSTSLHYIYDAHNYYAMIIFWYATTNTHVLEREKHTHTHACTHTHTHTHLNFTT